MNIKVRIEGKNINNYLKWLIKNKINLINIDIINYKTLEIIINYHDYPLLSRYSKTYKVTIAKKYGKLKLIDTLKNNLFILLSIILSLIFLYTLSNIIFSIDIIYNDDTIVDIIKKELNKYDIKKYKFKKSYSYLDKVKKEILKDNKDILEWIEIEENGTKYTIRLVERKKETKEKEYMYQSITSKKDATIISIDAYSGEKIKNINDYIKKGDTIISGIMTKPDGTNIYTKAKGIVLGEVWYKASIEYPIYYKEERVTGKYKDIFTIYFLNREIPLFPYKKYKQFKKKQHHLIEDNLIPISISKERIYEVETLDNIYTPEEVIDKAILVTKNKLLSNNNIKEIKDIIILDKEYLNSKIKLSLFISTIEDITLVKEEKIEEIIEN